MPNVNKVSTGLYLSRAAVDHLDKAARRTGLSRAVVVEKLAELFADRLSFDVSPEKTRVKKTSKKSTVPA